MPLLLLIWLATTAGQPPPHPLTEAEAVAAAETFVRVNGYVDPAAADPRAIRLERALTYGTAPEELLPDRVHTLLPQACGVFPRPLYAFDRGWSVVFCYDPRNARYRHNVPTRDVSAREGARVVIMNESGGEIFVAHQDLDREAPGMKRLPGMAAFEALLPKASAAECRPPRKPEIDPQIASVDAKAILYLFRAGDQNYVLALKRKGSVVEVWVFARCGLDASIFRLRKTAGAWRIIAPAP